MPSKIIVILEIALLIILSYFKYYSEIAETFLAKHQELNISVRFLFFLLLLDFARRSIFYSYRRHKNIQQPRMDNFLFGMNNLAKLFFGLGFTVTLFSFFGVDIRSLFTSLSIVAAAIAIITKEYINDFLVGLYFSFSNNFEINDYVQVGDHKGKISELQMLKVKVLNDNDDLVIIPNSKVYNNELINYTRKDIRLMSVGFQIDINSVESIEVLEQELTDALVDFREFLEPDSFNLKIVEMKKDSIDMRFQYTLKKIDRELQKEIRKKTVREVFNHISGKKRSIGINRMGE